MKAINSLLTVILLFVCFAVQAQNEQNHWYFGTYMGLKFTPSGPQALRDGKMYAPYGCATMSDSAGNLLFYTDGIKVWTASHQVMPNGDKLSNETYGIETMIQDIPGKPGMYYIFSIDNSSEIKWAEVDATKGAGQATVISKGNVLARGMDHHFTIVRMLYSYGYWLIGHQKGTDSFSCFRLTRNGIENKPVKSRAGAATNASAVYGYGSLESNNEGSKLVYCHTSFSTSESYAMLLDFDKACGTVSNSRKLDVPKLNIFKGYMAFGCFSPDNAKLYVSYNERGEGRLYQYDMKAADIPGSVLLINTSKEMLGEMRQGPDGFIYCTTSENLNVCPKLNVIEYPGLSGTACVFKKYGVDLTDAANYRYTEHLPKAMNDNAPNQPGFGGPPGIPMNGGCAGIPIRFPVPRDFFTAGILWVFGDPESGQDSSRGGFIITHTYKKPGIYTVKYYWYFCGYEYKIQKNIVITAGNALDLGKDTTLCYGSKLTLHATNPGATYLWNDGSKDSILEVDKSGIYSVEVNGGCGKQSDSIKINILPSLWITLGREYFICEDKNELVKLDAGKGFVHYKWYPTGDTTQWIIVEAVGDYYVTVSDFRGCPGDAGTRVQRRCEAKVWFPNAFTPNGDGLNDVFKAVGRDANQYQLMIFNRWGEKVFETDQFTEGWDGRFHGVASPNDEYIWIAKYTSLDKSGNEHQFYLNGNVALVE